MIIYLAINLVNDKRYIGCTVKKLEYRKQSHYHEATRGRGSETSFQHAIRTYGIENFDFKTIDSASSYKELREKEVFWIRVHGTLYPSGYNLNKGGNVWAGRKKTYKHKFELDGHTYDGIAGLAKAFGLTKKTVESRLYSNLNWSLRQIVGLDPAPTQIPTSAKRIYYEGVEYPSQRHLVRALSPELNEDTFRGRIERGMPIKEALDPERLPDPKSVKISAHGRKFRSLREAANFAGIEQGTLQQRISAGWTMEEAVSNKVRGLPVEVFGTKYKNKIELCKALGIDYNYFCKRMALGLSPEQVVKHEKTEYEKSLEFCVNGKAFASKKDAAEFYGLSPISVIKRLRRGWTNKEAVGVDPPPKKTNPRSKSVLVGEFEFPSMTAAANHFNVQLSSVSNRIARGWSEEQAFGIADAPKRTNGRGVPININGEIFHSITAAADNFNMCPNKLSNRLKLGWTAEQAVGLDLRKRKPLARDKLGRIVKKTV